MEKDKYFIIGMILTGCSDRIVFQIMGVASLILSLIDECTVNPKRKDAEDAH